MAVSTPVPLVLFAYARPDHLRRTLACLRENGVPLIYAFSDGPRTPDKAPPGVDGRPHGLAAPQS